MEEPEFRLYDLVVCTETGEVGVILELRPTIAIVQFPVGICDIERLDLEILERDASYYSDFGDKSGPFRRNRYELY